MDKKSHKIRRCHGHGDFREKKNKPFSRCCTWKRQNHGFHGKVGPCQTEFHPGLLAVYFKLHYIDGLLVFLQLPALFWHLPHVRLRQLAKQVSQLLGPLFRLIIGLKVILKKISNNAIPFEHDILKLNQNCYKNNKKTEPPKLASQHH